jgi:hypothetical protein
VVVVAVGAEHSEGASPTDGFNYGPMVVRSVNDHNLFIVADEPNVVIYVKVFAV